MEQFIVQLTAMAVLWIALCGCVYIVHQPTAIRLAWWPLRLLRRVVGWALIELGRAIAGGKKK
jgi:hypothetical protein